MENKLTTQVPALEKAVRICALLAEVKTASFSQIHQSLNLPKSTTHSLLAALVTHGLLRVDQDERYCLGLRFYEFGNKAAEHFDIRKEAMPFLYELREQTCLTCHLGVLEGKEAIYLVKLESPQPIVIKSWEGKRVSLHSSSLGKVLLAWRSDHEINAVYPDEPLPVYTDATLSTRSALYAELKRIKGRGWALDDGEDISGIRCIAAPIYNAAGQVIAAISAVGAEFQIPDVRVEELAILVRAAGINLSAVLGFKSYEYSAAPR